MSFGAGPSLAGILAFSGVNGSSILPNSAMAVGTSDCTDPANPPGNPPSCGNDSMPGGSNGMMPDGSNGAMPDGSNGGPQWAGYLPAFRQRMSPFTWDSAANACPPPTGVPPGCVLPSTRIALFPEGCAPAGEIQPGMHLLTRDADGNLCGEVVTAVRASTQPCVLLETEDGRQLHCSLSHEVMVADPECAYGRRTRVATLTLADCLLTEAGAAVALRSMVRQPDARVLLICLVGPQHVYLSEGLWSHNDLPTKIVVP